MPGLVPGIHAFLTCGSQGVDGRESPAMTVVKALDNNPT
jgi:hypothetical protein